MITKAEARVLVLKSLKDLELKNSNLSADEYAADVINVACKYILENPMLHPNVSPMPQLAFYDNYEQFSQIAKTFAASVENEYPFIASNTENLAQNICLNIGWDGMPGFLEDYFYKKHGNAVVELNRLEFLSSFHKRYERGIFVEESQVDRNIEMTFSLDWEKMSISITPSLSRKEGVLCMRKRGNVLVYKANPSYQFEIHLDSYDEVTFFALEILDRGLRIEYYE